MNPLATVLTALALAVGLACGGGHTGNPVADPEAALEADGEIAALCASVCKRIATSCLDDPTVEFEEEDCEEVCAGETDGVLEDADLCVDDSNGCQAALKCSVSFGA